jgi:hypothetical protein
MNKNPLEPIAAADPKLMERITGTRELTFADGAADGVRSLAMQAKQAGASKAEVMETLRVVYFIRGVGSIYTATRGLDGVFE